MNSLKIPFLLTALLAVTLQAQSPSQFLMIGSEDKCDNEILTTVSPDGDDFSSIANSSPWKPASDLRCMRDHSLIYYNDKVHKPYWLSAYTAEYHQRPAIKGDAFGLAKSGDLIHWTQFSPVAPSGIKEKVLHAWSPYLFQDPADGAIYVLITIGTTVDWKGIGYIKCTDPGTWKHWTDWTPFQHLAHNAGEYNGAAIYYLHGKYWFFYDDASRQNGYQAAEAYITSTTGFLSGYGQPTYIPSLNSTLSIDDHFNKKPPKQYRYEGMSLVWISGSIWRLYVQEIGHLNGVYINDIMGFVESDDNIATWGPFQFLGDSTSNVGPFTASHVYRLDTLKQSPK